MKIWIVKELAEIKGLDIEVKKKMELQLDLLEQYYAEREGGYVLNATEDIKVFNQWLGDYPLAVPEYKEEFKGSDQEKYTECLFLLSSDYHVIVFAKSMEIELLISELNY